MKNLTTQLLCSLAFALSLLTGRMEAEETGVINYWAPGVINQEAGSVEMDLKFLRTREEMLSDWFFAFRATGNSTAGGTSVLAMVFCPPGDDRDFLILAKGPSGSSYITPETPKIEVNKTYRVVFTWGDGQHSAWMDGKLLGRGSFKGALHLLPDQFQAGNPLAFAVEKLRISDIARPGAELSTKAELKADEHTTLFADGSGKVQTSGKSVWQEKTFGVWAFPDRHEAKLVVEVDKTLPVPLRVVNFSGSDATMEVKCEVSNRAGKAVASQSYKVPVKAGATYDLAEIQLPAVKQSGYYAVKIAVKSPQGREAVYDWSYVAQPVETAKPGKLADYLGHHFHFDKPDFYTQLGINWHRSWANERSFLWCNVEPEKGKFQWGDADHSLAIAQKSGVQVLGLLGYPPTWASSRTDEEVNRVKAKSAKTYLRRPERFQPKSVKDWEDYVRAVVSRYHDRVKYWEIYNEVDFHPPFLFASFSGSTEDYYKLLESAYKIIKEIDPTCQVLTSGFSLTQGVTDTGMPADLMKLGAAKYFDIFAIHGYAGRDSLSQSMAAARAAKPNVPMWQTERQYMGGYMDENQAVQAAFWCLDNGFSKYFFHESDNDRNYGGLKPTPYYAVTSEVARQLRVCNEYVGKLEGLSGAGTGWTLKRSDGGMLYAIAANSGTVKLTFDSGKPDTVIAVTDLYGEPIFNGKIDPSKPVEFSGLVYVTSPLPLKVAKVEREVGNCLANPSFEIRDGDVAMDEAAAQPGFWTMSPADMDRKNFRFTKESHTGEWAYRLTNPAGGKGIWVGQALVLDTPGEWMLSAWVRVEKGKTVRVKFFMQVPGIPWPGPGDAIAVTGTGEWQRLEQKRTVAQAGVRATVLVGIQDGESVLEIDDIELLPQLKPAAAQ